MNLLPRLPFGASFPAGTALPRCPIVSALILAMASGAIAATPPRYSHVVIVMEENRTPTQIIGDTTDAPYINSLANGGVKMGHMFAITHPSQPNYINLFSGAGQGILDDNLPPNFSTTNAATYPFRTPNLGAEIIAAGFTFAGFSEQIETAGTNDWADYDPHSATSPDVDYRRKHSPWVNWIAKTSPVPANQLSPAVNRSFAEFPANFSDLPTVSFIIPNQMHDMHDGSRKQGDDWLRDHLDAYAKWAKTNNSLLIITWDEDDFNSVNQIPTVLYGAGLRDGTTVDGTWTHHNTLRTIEDMYGATHAGSAAQVRSIVGPFASDPVVITTTFRQGLNGYAGSLDTQLSQEAPAANNAASALLTADLDTASSSGNQQGQVLLRFNSVFGVAANQVPTNAIIHSAKLILFTPLSPSGEDFDSSDVFRAHRMLVDWTDAATWNGTGAGISTDNVEASSTATFSLVPEVDGAPQIFDVTADVELFRTGAANRGWLIRPSTSGTGNGWTMASSEYTNATQRPALEITYSMPPGQTPYGTWAAANGLSGVNSAANADPDHDGIPNLSEFAYNLNPLVPDNHPVTATSTNGLPSARYLANVSGGVLELQFVRRKTPSGITYTAQFSSSLISGWTDAPAPVVTAIDAEWERVTIRDTVSATPTRFAKVTIQLP